MKGLKVLIFLLMFLGAGYSIWYGVSASKCPDSDLDGLDDCEEAQIYHTEMYNPDTDGDGFNDGEEIANGYSPHNGNRLKLSDVDSDRDGLTDDKEVEFKTNLNNPDTDGDGINDFVESKDGSNPNDPVSMELKKTLKDKILEASF